MPIRKKITKFIGSKKGKTFSLLFLVLIASIFLFPQAAAADPFTWVADTVGGFVGDILIAFFLLIIQFLGFMFVILVGLLVDVAQFNTFTTMGMVEVGWGLVRDVANMFFIVILLVIAFSTILKIQSYHYQKTFMKLLLMAILINFSKLIAGFLIDFFQVIMLTFVNGFKDVAGGNFAESFGLYKLLSLSLDDTFTGSGFQSDVVVAAILGVVLILIADMTILIMLAVLLYRIVMLWVLIIISPLAYLAYAAMPKYWSLWWSEFFKHLVSGPVIAFFLWLALITMQKGEIAEKFKESGIGGKSQELKSEEKIFLVDFSTADLLNYMVVIALLMGGLTVAQKMASQSGGAVGAFAQRVQKYGTRAGFIMTGAAGAIGVGRLAGKGAKTAYDWGARRIAQKTKGVSDILLRPLRTVKGFQAGLERKAKLEDLEIKHEAGKLLEGGGKKALLAFGASEDMADVLQGFLYMKGAKGIIKGNARTYRIKAEEIQEKKEEQHQHMKYVKRPDADEYYMQQLEKNKDTSDTAKDEYEKNKTLQDAAELGDEDAKDQLLDNAKVYLEDEYNKKKKEKELLEAGGLSDLDKESANDQIGKNKDKMRDISDKIITARKDNDPTQVEALKKIYNALTAENRKLNALAGAKNSKHIDKALKNNYISPEDITKNKESNKGNIRTLEDEMKKIDDYAVEPVISKGDREARKQKADVIGGEIEKLQERLSDINAHIPQAYYSRQAGRVAMHEKQKENDTTNEHELITLFNSAKQTGDISKLRGVTAAAASAMHLNEIIMSQKASYDHKDKKGNIIFKENEYFQAGVEGLHALINDVFVKQMGMSKQVAYESENDFSDIAQQVNHWTYAQSMGVEGGQFTQRSREVQQSAAATEKSKGDFEGNQRRLNRLGHATERWVDPMDPSKGRMSIINESSIEEIRSSFRGIGKLIEKERYNPNWANNLTTKYNMEVLDSIGKTYTTADDKKEWDAFMKSLLKYVGKTKQEAMTQISVDSEQTQKLGFAKSLRRESSLFNKGN